MLLRPSKGGLFHGCKGNGEKKMKEKLFAITIMMGWVVLFFIANHFDFLVAIG